ncbi:unnamed protein product [Amoebophrya sp. A120]|nr:unnamed protein product [Amoebophrya sp. A120]|eukprot:GSA120T00000257001.1
MALCASGNFLVALLHLLLLNSASFSVAVNIKGSSIFTTYEAAPAPDHALTRNDETIKPIQQSSFDDSESTGRDHHDENTSFLSQMEQHQEQQKFVRRFKQFLDTLRRVWTSSNGTAASKLPPLPGFSNNKTTVGDVAFSKVDEDIDDEDLPVEDLLEVGRLLPDADPDPTDKGYTMMNTPTTLNGLGGDTFADGGPHGENDVEVHHDLDVETSSRLHVPSNIKGTSFLVRKTGIKRRVQLLSSARGGLLGKVANSFDRARNATVSAYRKFKGGVASIKSRFSAKFKGGCHRCRQVRMLFAGTAFGQHFGRKYLGYLMAYVAMGVASSFGSVLILRNLLHLQGLVFSAAAKGGFAVAGTAGWTVLTWPVLQSVALPLLGGVLLFIICDQARQTMLTWVQTNVKLQLIEKVSSLATGPESRLLTGDAAVALQQIPGMVSMLFDYIPAIATHGASMLFVFGATWATGGTAAAMFPLVVMVVQVLLTVHWPILDDKIGAIRGELGRAQEMAQEYRAQLGSPEKLNDYRENAQIGKNLVELNQETEQQVLRIERKLQKFLFVKKTLGAISGVMAMPMLVASMMYGALTGQDVTAAYSGAQAIQGITGELMGATGNIQAATYNPLLAKFMNLISLSTRGENATHPLWISTDRTRDRVSFEMERVNLISGGDIGKGTQQYLWPVRCAANNKNCTGGQTLQFPAGSITHLTAPSGQGKSVLMKLVSAFPEPSLGKRTIRWNGVPIAENTGEKKRAVDPENDRDIAMIRLQRHYQLVTSNTPLPGRSIRQQLLGGNPNKLTDEDLKLVARVTLMYDKLLQHGKGLFGPANRNYSEAATWDEGFEKNHESFFNFTEILDAVPKETGTTYQSTTLPVINLSDGERVRYRLTFALAMRPRLLLLDEATKGLDPTSHPLVVRNVMCFAAVYGITVIFTTHEANVFGESLFGDPQAFTMLSDNPGCHIDLTDGGCAVDPEEVADAYEGDPLQERCPPGKKIPPFPRTIGELCAGTPLATQVEGGLDAKFSAHVATLREERLGTGGPGSSENSGATESLKLSEQFAPEVFQYKLATKGDLPKPRPCPNPSRFMKTVTLDTYGVLKSVTFSTVA